MANEQQPNNGGNASTAVKKYENISEQVLAKIEMLQQDGGILLPKNYSVENHIKSAWLILQETTDRSGKPALEVCTKPSIANALFDMVLQGLSVSKNQGYFIVYGKELQFQRSYFGTVALAKRAGGMVGEPVANVIYEGDDFVFKIDAETGRKSIVKHEQKIENIDNSKIKGAYAIATFADGTREVTIMSMAQIRAAWNQGQTKGQSPAHKNFPEEMAKKTVIGRACKMVINSSDDSWLCAGESLAEVDPAERQREAMQAPSKQVLDEPTTVVDVTHEMEVVASEPANTPEPIANPQPEPQKASQKPQPKAAPQEEFDFENAY